MIQSNSKQGRLHNECNIQGISRYMALQTLSGRGDSLLLDDNNLHQNTNWRSFFNKIWNASETEVNVLRPKVNSSIFILPKKEFHTFSHWWSVSLCRPGFRRQRLWNTRGWSRARPWLDHRETTASCRKPVMAPPFFFYTLVLCQRWHQTVQECVWNGRNTLASVTLHHVSHHFEVLPFAPTSPSFLTHFRLQTRGARLLSTRLAALL